MMKRHKLLGPVGWGVAIALSNIATLGLTPSSLALTDAGIAQASSIPNSPVYMAGIPQEPTTQRKLVVDLSDRQVYVYDTDEVTASYPVAIGRDGWETPTGEFSIIRMQKDPYWQHPFNDTIFPPGPNNPLGTRWIGFWTDGENTIGFHGTPTRNSIGQAASHGCVRMYDEDAIALFEQVQVGTPVHVIP